MAGKIDLTGRVALVTGAGNGLGREYALELARRGASIVVNDLGTSLGGEGRSSEAAARVVAEIEARGGKAVANAGSVTSMEDAEAMVAEAIKAFGRIDIVISNAGILRDASFKKMAIENFETVIDVHLLGAARIIKAAWNIMSEAGYGRIVVATSGAGLYGNFGQANYGAAKAGLIGLMNALKIEGQKNDIRVNAISPIAATRMTDGILPGEVATALAPRHVAEAVAFLCSDDAPNGVILTSCATHFSTTVLVETPGVTLPRGASGAEDIAAAWGRISDRAGATPFASALEQSALVPEWIKQD
jgi:NAD(P)-dependent dehydrogenase (short-subunit alcohol dehydrogenase family)